MLKSIKILFDDIKGDILSCWYFANHIITNPPIDKRFALLGIAFIVILPFFVIKSEDGIILYFVRVIFASITTFAILTWSNTFWFLMKKAWMYKIHIKKRKSINYYLKNIDAPEVGSIEIENPEKTLYEISDYAAEGYKYHAIRNGIEVGVLLVILFITLPNFFLFNLAIVFLQFFYVMTVDNQSSSQVFNDLKTLVICIHRLYKENPEECKKFIVQNKKESIRDLEAIYHAIDMEAKRTS